MSARKSIGEYRKLFVDVETSGLNIWRDEVIELGAVLTDPSGEFVIDVLSIKVQPSRPVPLQVAAINGYDADVWQREAYPPSIAAAKLSLLSYDAIFVAHNVGFDWPFVLSLLGEEPWRGDYHRICTVALAMPLAERGRVSSVSLKGLCEHFKIPQPVAHRALADANACRAVYRALCNELLPR